MSNVFQGTSSESRDAAMNAAFSMAMASVANLPEGTRYHIVIEGCDANSGGTFSATARLVILEEATEAESPDIELQQGEDTKKKKKEELQQRLEERGVDVERLERDGLDLDILIDIIEDQQMADEMIAEWFAATELNRKNEMLALQPEPAGPAPQEPSQDAKNAREAGVYMPPVLSAREEVELKEKITAEISTILEEYMMEKIVNILSEPDVAKIPGFWDEMQRVKEMVVRELAENVINSVFRLGGSIDEQKQSLALRVAENMLLDGIIDKIWKDYEPQPGQDKTKKPHIDTLDLVA